MSKLNQEKLKEHIAYVMANKTERKFTQSLDLQIILRDYNPMKEKRINSMIDLNHQCRTNQKVMAICNMVHREECQKAGLECIDLEGIQAFKKDKKAIMKWARNYDLILVSQNLNKKVIRAAGKALGAVARLPIQVAENDSIARKLGELKRSVRFRTKKVAWMGTAVGVETLAEEDIRQNVVKAINFLISLLPKGWLNIRTIHLKTTMGKPARLY